MHSLNRLLSYGLKRLIDVLHGRNPFCLNYGNKRKEKLQKKTKHVINTNAQFVTFNSNNKL